MIIDILPWLSTYYNYYIIIIIITIIFYTSSLRPFGSSTVDPVDLSRIEEHFPDELLALPIARTAPRLWLESKKN